MNEKAPNSESTAGDTDYMVKVDSPPDRLECIFYRGNRCIAPEDTDINMPPEKDPILPAIKIDDGKYCTIFGKGRLSDVCMSSILGEKLPETP